MTEDADFEAQLASLRERFGSRLAEYRIRLVEARNALAADPGGDEPIRRLKRVSHDLAGAGGTFGYPEISECAVALEDAVDAALAGTGPRDAVIAPLRALLREVELTL